MARLLIQNAAELEHLSPELQMCWGGPFKGQTGRIAIVDELLALLKPPAIIETGTFRGISTVGVSAVVLRRSKKRSTSARSAIFLSCTVLLVPSGIDSCLT